MNYRFLIPIFFAFLFQATTASLEAQDLFSMQPTDSLIVNDLDHIATVHFIYLRNESDDMLTLKWRLIEDEFPEEWFIELCDNTTCYSIIPNTAIQNPIAPGEDAFLKLTVNPQGSNTPAYMTFRVSENGDDDNFKIAHFYFNPSPTTTTQNVNVSDIKIFPNPADTRLNISNESFTEDTEWQLFHPTTGQMVLGGKGLTVPMSTLISGQYILRLQNDQHIFQTVVQKY